VFEGGRRSPLQAAAGAAPQLGQRG